MAGVLEDVSLDAVEDEKTGLVYIARVALVADADAATAREVEIDMGSDTASDGAAAARPTIRVGQKRVPLGPGMAATAEIKTVDKRLIEFLLSPLLRYADESFRER